MHCPNPKCVCDEQAPPRSSTAEEAGGGEEAADVLSSVGAPVAEAAMVHVARSLVWGYSQLVDAQNQRYTMPELGLGLQSRDRGCIMCA